jgi:type I restriction enzyme S subunit
MNTNWPQVRLSEVAKPVERPEVPRPGKNYRQIGVKLWGEGAYERGAIDGARTQYAQLFRAEAGDIIVNKIWARNGSVAVVPDSLGGCWGSGEFPMFSPKEDRLDSRWMHWLTKTRDFWSQCDEKSRGTSGKNRIRPERFLEIEIPLPPLSEQRRIVARIEALAAKTEEAHSLSQEIATDEGRMLSAAFSRLMANSTLQTMREAAPITRRPVQLETEGTYLELGIRSFGKGTFHKPALTGIEVGTKKLFRIEPGDLVFNNVFAWEGAVAVARPEDARRVGSHRFITCVPQKGVATADFLCFYFLTEEGLSKVGEASPGGAGRNRTLGLEALSAIQVPLPPYKQQLWFDELQAKVRSLKKFQAESAAELDALLPSILDKAFKGEL